jgi:sugar O-acyltransferase (sialic acid O-acetyltransferase NeuD family)
MVVDDEYYKEGTSLLSWDWLEVNSKRVIVIPAVGVSEVRQRMVEKAASLGCTFTNIIHRTTIISSTSCIAEGVVICGNSILNADSVIGNFCQLNMYCTVAHDSILEDYVTLSMGVHIAGKVVVKEGAYLGSGVQMVPPLTIGEWSKVGAGTVLVEDVPANSTVVGNPGRVVRQREVGWQLEHIKSPQSLKKQLQSIQDQPTQLL